MRVTTPYTVENRGWPNFNLQHRLLRDGRGKLAILYQRGIHNLSAGFSDNGGRDWSEPVDIMSKMETPVAAAPDREGFHGLCAGGNPPELRHFYVKDGKWDTTGLEFNGERGSIFFAPDLALYGVKGIFAVYADVDSKTGGWRISCRERDAGGNWRKKGKMPWAGRDKGTISLGEKNTWRLYSQCLCTGGEGQIHLSHRDLKDGYLQIFYSTYLPAKSAWSTVKQITDTPYHKSAPSVMWDEWGVVLTWVANYGGTNAVEFYSPAQGKNILKPGPATGQRPPLLRVIRDKVWIFWQWKEKLLCCPRDEADKIRCVKDLPAKTSRVEFDIAWEPDGEKIFISTADAGSDGTIEFTMVPLVEVLQFSVINDQLPDVGVINSAGGGVKEGQAENAAETARQVNYLSEDDAVMKVNTSVIGCGLKEGGCNGEIPRQVVSEGDITGHLVESPAQVVDEPARVDAGVLDEDMCSSSIWIPAKKMNPKTADKKSNTGKPITNQYLPPVHEEMSGAKVSEPGPQVESQKIAGAEGGAKDKVEVRVLPPVVFDMPGRSDYVNHTLSKTINNTENETVSETGAGATGTLEGADSETETPVVHQNVKKKKEPDYFVYNLYKILY